MDRIQCSLRARDLPISCERKRLSQIPRHLISNAKYVQFQHIWRIGMRHSLARALIIRTVDKAWSARKVHGLTRKKLGTSNLESIPTNFPCIFLISLILSDHEMYFDTWTEPYSCLSSAHPVVDEMI